MSGVGYAPSGIAEFVNANSRDLLRTAWFLTGDWAAAEDLVQSALAAVWPRWDSIADPAGYVRRVMVTTYLRWRSRRWVGEIATESLPELPGADSTDVTLSRRVLLDALATLPRQQRAAVVLRYFADQTETQAADAMGCSVGAVKSHTARAIARLREIPSVASLGVLS